ncbi:MAG: TIGR00725 family protein [Myxococcota bacterium]
MRRPRHIAVVGAGMTLSPDLEALAERVGVEVARAGCTLVCGGLGGVMEAACRGARSQGGRTIGILPGGDAEEANPFVEVVITTGLGEVRNLVIVRSADAVIAIGGRHGTLSEVAFALLEGRPVVGLGTWRLTAPGRHTEEFVQATDAKDAVRLALHALSARGGRSG